MWQQFEGDIYTSLIMYAADPSPCGEISRAAFIGMSWQKYAMPFRGQRDLEVWQNMALKLIDAVL